MPSKLFIYEVSLALCNYRNAQRCGGRRHSRSHLNCSVFTIRAFFTQIAAEWKIYNSFRQQTRER